HLSGHSEANGKSRTGVNHQPLFCKLKRKDYYMGYAVLHMEKTSGTDAAMSAHIERTIKPKNANESRTHLNREVQPSAIAGIA
ncbi:hypothetical protein, partial [Muribaculum intestinale]